MESPHEPRPHQDKLDVRPQSRPSQIRLQKEIFQAVKDLGQGHWKPTRPTWTSERTVGKPTRSRGITGFRLKQPPQPWVGRAGHRQARKFSAVPLPTKNPEAPRKLQNCLEFFLLRKVRCKDTIQP